MADEPLTTGPADGSKIPPIPQQTGEPEAHPVRENTPSQATSQDDLSNGARIIEETVIRPPVPLRPPQEAKPPQVPLPPAPPPLPAPIPKIESFVPPPVPVFAEPKTLSPKDDLASVPLEENKIPPIAPEPPREKTAAPITPPPPISPSPVQAPDVFEKERTDISQILKEVKLPERRPPVSSALAGGAVPQAHVFDTALGAAADKKPPDTVQAAPVPETPSIP